MSDDKWAVLVTENGQDNPLNPGSRETTVDQPSQDAARQFYADSLRAAQSGRWESVKLRKDDEIIDEWPSDD
jgi:hypothetical protein